MGAHPYPLPGVRRPRQQEDDPLAGYTPDWRQRISGAPTPEDDPLAGYTPDWRERLEPEPSLPEPPKPVAVAQPPAPQFPDLPEFAGARAAQQPPPLMKRVLLSGVEQQIEAGGEILGMAGRALERGAPAKPTRRGGYLESKYGITELPARPAMGGPVPKAITRAGARVAGAARERRAAIPRSAKGMLDPDATLEERLEALAFGVGEGLVSTVPSVVGGLAGAAVAGVPGAVVGAGAPAFALNASDLRRELVESGVDEDRADRIAAIGSVPVTALDMIPSLRIVGRLTGTVRARAIRWAVGRAMADIADQGLLEGLTEGTQEFIQDLIASQVTGRALDPRRYPEAALIGLGVGVLTGGGAHVVSQAAEREGEAGADPLAGYTPDWRKRQPEAGAPGAEPSLAAAAAAPPKPGLRRRLADVIDPTRRAELEAALTDPMTGLPNQTAFEHTRARLDVDPAYHVASLDLSNLKAINDDPSLGRQVADERLAEVASVLQEEAARLGISGRDVQRAGGDEFAVWGTDPKTLRQLIDAAKQRVRPLQIGEFTSHLRGGVGPNWLDAEAAAQRAKKVEVGPRARPSPPRGAAAPVAPGLAPEAVPAPERPAAAPVRPAAPPSGVPGYRPTDVPRETDRPPVVSQILSPGLAREEGRHAFARGEPRVVPDEMKTTPEKKAWYAGWDTANLASPQRLAWAPQAEAAGETAERPEDLVEGAPAWEITAVQYARHRAMERTGQARVTDAADGKRHADIVRRAVERGEDVPAHVLRYYGHEPWAQAVRPALAGRPLEEVRAEAEAATAARFAKGRAEGTEVLDRDLARLEQQPEEDDLEILYRDRIEAAIGEGRPVDARALYGEATAIDPDTEEHRWLNADRKLEGRIARAEQEAATQEEMPFEPAPERPPSIVPRSRSPTAAEWEAAIGPRAFSDLQGIDVALESTESLARLRGLAQRALETTTDLSSRRQFTRDLKRLDAEIAKREATPPSEVTPIRPGVAEPEAPPVPSEAEPVAGEPAERSEIAENLAARAEEISVRQPDRTRRTLESVARSLRRGESENAATNIRVLIDRMGEGQTKRSLQNLLVDIATLGAPTAEEQGFTVGGFIERPVPTKPTPGMRAAAEELEAELGGAPEPTGKVIPTYQEGDEALRRRQENVERFMAFYEPALREAVRTKPGEYGYGQDKVPGVLTKMRTAFEKGSYNMGPAIQAAAHSMGLKPTRKALETFFETGQGATVAPTAAEPQIPGEEVPRVKLPATPRGQPAGEPPGDVPRAEEEREAEGAPRRRQPGRGEPVPAGVGGPEAEPAVQPGGLAERPGGVGGRAGAERAGVRAERPGAGARPGDRESPDAGVLGRNYRVRDAADLKVGRSLRQKSTDNLETIRLLKQIEQEGRPATTAEQDVLARYVGWGGMPQMFEPWRKTDFTEAAEQLQELLTTEEYEAARRSTPNAHYTSPDVVQAVWAAVERLGYRGGRLLEPGMGVGYFPSLIPGRLAGVTRYSGIELDSVTGRIAKLLFPRWDIRVQGFEVFQAPDGFYDAAIGNVPFGNYRLHDPRYNKHGFSIHDYFFAKALDKVKPGGVVAFVTSRYTMDREDRATRTYLAERADLVGAIRLPNTAFKKVANTEVTADIIILRKRQAGEVPAGETWAEIEPLGDTEIDVNEYFVRHPEMMLGEMALTGTMYRGQEPTLEPTAGADLGEQLQAAVRRLPEGITGQPAGPTTDVAVPETIVAPETVKEGAFTVRGGKLLRRLQGNLVPADVPASAIERVKALVEIRDATRAVLHAQLTDQPDIRITATQKELQRLYAAFRKRYGPINRRSGTRRPNLEGFHPDPDAPLVMQLERVDEDREVYDQADIFTERVIRPPKPVESVDRPEDALIAVLNERGRVDVPRMAQLARMTEADIVAALGGRIFENPESGQWETADQYLSGNVRTKLAVAQGAAQADPRYQHNVDALQQVQPDDLPPSRIAASLGAPWIPPSDITQFIGDLINSGDTRGISVAYSPAVATWKVDVPKFIQSRPSSILQWGTEDYPLPALVGDALNLREVKVWYRDPDGKSHVDTKATALAQDKLQEIKDRFAQWVWEAPERATRLHRVFNDTQNNLRMIQPDGSHMTLSGIASVVNGKPFKFWPHQKDTIWRIVQFGNTLLAQVVGSGKTFIMQAAGMELKRIGVVHKPMYIVPNQMLEQFTREFVQLYPAARVLMATKDDLSKKNRRAFVAKVATNDWDAVVMTHSMFGLIPMSPAFETQFLRTQVAILEQAMVEAAQEEGRAAKSLTKMIEKSKLRYEARLKEMENRDRKDDGLSFEELGIDALFVDEAHMFKNLYASTKMPKLGYRDTKRAMDLYMKTSYLHHLTPGHGLVFATATPISNSIVEMYTMLRYLSPSMLAERGVEQLDAWAATFAEPRTELELRPEGGFRMYTRFSRFKNITALSQMFRQVADVKTAEDLKLPRPKVRGGKSEIVSVPASDPLRQFMKGLEARAERVRKGQVKPKEDNMLAISNDGKKAALDMRLLGAGYRDEPGSKVNVAVDRIHDVWQRTAATRRTQLVFLDLSTPKRGGQFSLYDDIRTKLVKRGIPAKEVAFIHDAKTDMARARLFAKVRSGAVRILIGSSEKMGTGVNIQDRLIALHEVDPPITWRPSEVEQRRGRILRQGNENPEVEMYVYVTEESFDGYMWQTLEYKAAMIDQIMRAEPGVDVIEDVESRAFTYAEVKAIATGNPMVLEKAKVDVEVVRLSRLERDHFDRQFAMRRDLATLPEEIAAFERRQAEAEADARRLVDRSGDKFTITLEGRTYTKRADAGAALMQRITAEGERYLKADEREHAKWPSVRLGDFAGLELWLDAGGPRAYVSLRGARSYETNVGYGSSAEGAIQAVEYLPKRVAISITEAQQEITERERRVAELEKLVGQASPHAARLADLVKRQQEIDHALDLDKKPSDAGTIAAEAEATDEDLPERLVSDPESGLEAAEEGAPEPDPTEGATPSEIQDRLDQIAEIREEMADAPLEDQVGAVFERFPDTRLDASTSAALWTKLTRAGVTKRGSMPDAELVQLALSSGMLDDVTATEIGRAIGLIADEGGFLRVPGVSDQPPEMGGGPGPRVYAEAEPRQITGLEAWVMPVSRMGKRMLHSKREDVRVIGRKVLELQRAGRTATLAFKRLIDEFDTRLTTAIQGLNKGQRNMVASLLDQYDALPADWSGPPRIREAFDLLRTGFRHDWRRLGENERLMLSDARRGMLDLALKEWPEGGSAPDFDATPVNFRNIMAAADLEGITQQPTSRDGWESLVAELKDAGRRVQRAVFITSPDLRRIYDMLQGRGGIMAYLPHVFKGDWVVRAGPQTARFVDREEGAAYARRLLEQGLWHEDLIVEREGFIPESALYLSRAQYFRLQRALKRELADEGAVVSKATGQAGIKLKPRRRWYAHGMRREVNLQTFERDLVKALRAYHYRTAKKLAFDPFRKVAVDLAESFPFEGGWREWATGYIGDLQGVPHHWVELVNATFEQLGIKPWFLQRAASRWQQAMSYNFLGYSPSTAALNLAQLANNTIPRFERNGHKWFLVGLRALTRSNAEDQAVLDFVGTKLTHPKYLAGEYLPRGVRINEDAWYMPMFMFNKTEDMNRGVTALARYYERRDAGLSQQAAMEEALEFTMDTHFDYSLADAPGILRNPIGRALFQFKTFPINQIFFAESLFRWGNARQRALFIAYLMAFGGLAVLWLGTPLFILNWLSGKTGLFRDEAGRKQTAWDELADHTRNAGVLWRMAKYGLLGAFGLDVSQRMGFGGPREFEPTTIPGRQLELIVRALKSENPTERAAAMRALLPAQVRRLVAAADASSTSVIRDRFGRVRDEDVSTTDIVGLALGVQTVEQAETWRRMDREYQVTADYRGQRSNYLDRATTALREGGSGAAQEIVQKAKADGITITLSQVREHRRRQDQADIERRLKRTPKDLREDLFTPEERARVPSGRRPPGAPRPPQPPRQRRPRPISVAPQGVTPQGVTEQPKPPAALAAATVTAGAQGKKRRRHVRILARDEQGDVTDFEVIEV